MSWRLGYVPLTDAAVLIAAVERGFAAQAGLSIELVRQPSWATLRDELALGHLDGAHMLAPLAVAASLGLSGPQTDLAAVFALSLNGNAVTLSEALWAEMDVGEDDDLARIALAFARAGRARAATGRPLVLATVFPYSCHTYQLHRFAALGGGDLPDFAELVVVPPPRTAEALGSGAIDGFCVGSPWNSVAVAAGTGRIAASGNDLAPDSPEKVLALRRDRLPEAAPLVAALRRASAWCASPGNHAALAEILARPTHLGIDAELILRTLEGRLPRSKHGPPRLDPRYVAFPGDGALTTGQIAWLTGEMIAAGQIPDAQAETARRILGGTP